MTEETAEALKSLILNDVNAELPGLATDGVTLPAIAEKNIVLGTVDLSRYESPVVVSILPDKVEPIDGDLDGYRDKDKFVVTMIFQKAAYPILVKRMFRYAKALRLAMEKNPSMDGQIDDSGIDGVDFYPDTGDKNQTVTAFEAEVWANESESIGD